MPRGLTEPQQEFAKEVFRSLLQKYPTQEEIGELLNIHQSRVSGIASSGKTSLQVLLAAAVLDGRSRDEISRRAGAHAAAAMAAVDPPFQSILAGVNEMPGFRAWLHTQPLMTVSHVNYVIEAFLQARPKCDDQGPVPGGWGPFVSQVLSGRVGELKAQIARQRQPSPHPPRTTRPPKARSR